MQNGIYLAKFPQKPFHGKYGRINKFILFFTFIESFMDKTVMSVQHIFTVNASLIAIISCMNWLICQWNRCAGMTIRIVMRKRKRKKDYNQYAYYT